MLMMERDELRLTVAVYSNWILILSDIFSQSFRCFKQPEVC